MTDRDQLPYRPCAGVMLANRDGRIFVGQRLDSKSEAWQMPQGGIDPGEGAEAAAIRELRSEEHTSELQSLMRISYAVFCLKKKTKTEYNKHQQLIEL